MAFLRKRRKADEHEDDNGEEKMFQKRRIRDLKPENRKRRKELPKPWGKKERYLILAILVLTVGASAVLGLSSRAWKLPGLPRLQIPKITLPFSGEETIFIEGDKERIRDREKSEEIIKIFKEKTKNLTGVYGLYIVNLESGFSYGVNEREIFETASLNKLPVMAGMFIEEESRRSGGTSGPEEESFLETKYLLKDSDKVIGAGTLYARPEGYEITYRNLVRLMGKQSDNTAFAITRKILGEEKIGEVIATIGMKETSLSENKTTPSDIGTFFEELWQGNIVSKESAEELLDYLTDTAYETLIPEGIPDDVRVAHKYGAETNVLNDAGIIYTEKPSILVMMGKGVVAKDAESFIREFARIVYGD
jgi:beta-lactamase class A